ncbi:carbonic anhydrase 5B, mitochondrial-like [Uloborus diversus]|uniref:carbonic anhydrase 5B, mitochondrial-like n=1 Tax=Uloborus diversus TaxID=327109 RepID=UPI002409EC5F|nr:carbonic anhydrase 5B, mitochondrial-like [Uloborus diversus]
MQRPLRWTYVPKNCRSLLNTGEGWKVIIEGQDSCLTGGPLQHSYQLVQFHSHWGKCHKTGSEHTVDGEGFAAELHLVHWNMDLYNSVEEALASKKGVAVIGVFFQIGKHHDELAKITDLLCEIVNKGDECPLSKKIDPSAFFPVHDYWTYEGSLTTPPCHESVTWILFKKPVEVSEEQLDKFKMLFSSTLKAFVNGAPIRSRVVENCRPSQPLNGRVIREATC